MRSGFAVVLRRLTWNLETKPSGPASENSFGLVLSNRRSASTAVKLLTLRSEGRFRVTSQDELKTSILMMLAGNYDRWQVQLDPEGSETLAKSTALVAEGIAARLSQSINENPGPLDEGRWRSFVKSAASKAFIELPDDGPLVGIGQNPSFIQAVVSCTGKLVAPQCSPWWQSLMAKQEQGLRNHLQEFQIPRTEIDEIIGDLRRGQSN